MRGLLGAGGTAEQHLRDEVAAAQFDVAVEAHRKRRQHAPHHVHAGGRKLKAIRLHAQRPDTAVQEVPIPAHLVA